MTRVFLTATLAASLLAGATAANAAQTISFTPQSAVDGSIAGSFGNNGGIAAGLFTDTYTFSWPTPGLTAGTISSSFTSATNDINFTSVTLNGVDFDFVIGGPGRTEFRDISLATTGGLQTLIVKGSSPGPSATYNGTLTFTPGIGAVPETGTWALMIVGFGGAGAMLRRRRTAALAAAA